LRLHLDHANAEKQAGHKPPTFIEMLARSVVLTSFAMSSLVMLGMFLVIPNISAYIQGNLGYPRDKLSFLYLAGVAVSFFTLQLAGKLVDRYGPVGVASVGSLIMIITLYVGYVIEPPTSAVLPIFVAFMICSTFRNVPMQVLTSQVPFPPERARFMSLQSAVQHLSIAFGSFLSSVLLSQGDGGRLEGMATVGWLSVAFSTTMPVMLYYVQRMVKAQQSNAAFGRFPYPVQKVIKNRP
jgi:predicted MFS family arabinose efflux permease